LLLSPEEKKRPNPSIVNRRWKRFVSQFRPSRWFGPATAE
jgi:hypothetical protein